jgi:hypothetical protein
MGGFHNSPTAHWDHEPVAQPSRLQVPAASRRFEASPSETLGKLAGGTPTLHGSWRVQKNPSRILPEGVWMF